MTGPDTPSPERPDWLDTWLKQAESSGEIIDVEFDGSWVVRFGKPLPQGRPFTPPPAEHVSEVGLVFTEKWRFVGIDWPKGAVITSSPPRGAVILGDPKPVSARLLQQGGGDFSLEGDSPLRSPIFGFAEGAGSTPAVRLSGSGDRVFDATGHVFVHMSGATGGVLRGSAKEGVRLKRLWGLNAERKAGELDNVDIFALRYADLDTLSRVQRLRPFWPRKTTRRLTVDRQEAFSNAGKMDMDTKDAALKESRLVEFWDRFVVSLEDQHPGGGNMAVAREVAYQVRRDSLAFHEPERWLLEVARAFGYGTRIGRPFFAWLAACVLAAVTLIYGFGFPGVGDFFGLLLDLLLAPINLIRASESALLTSVIDMGAWQRLLVALVRLIGAASIAFAAVAIRTYTRFNR